MPILVSLEHYFTLNRINKYRVASYVSHPRFLGNTLVLLLHISIVIKKTNHVSQVKRLRENKTITINIVITMLPVDLSYSSMTTGGRLVVTVLVFCYGCSCSCCYYQRYRYFIIIKSGKPRNRLSS